jgi:hypothetical protein
MRRFSLASWLARLFRIIVFMAAAALVAGRRLVSRLGRSRSGGERLIVTSRPPVLVGSLRGGCPQRLANGRVQGKLTAL